MPWVPYLVGVREGPAAQFWMDTDVADPTLRRAVLLGRDSPSPIEAAIGVGTGFP
jgi:hypothetical protein